MVAPLCVACGDELASWRVLSTQQSLCHRCRRLPSSIDLSRAAGHYEGSLREIVHAFKYGGRRQLDRPLAGLMLEAGTSLLRDADCVVPVPLHPWRKAQRGFNQAELLARKLGLPVTLALWRVRPTAPQIALGAGARRRNLARAIRLSPLLMPWHRSQWLEDKRIVLVDDVRTTGATLEACAALLKRAGAREVRALTVAKADLRRLDRVTGVEAGLTRTGAC